MKRSTDKSQEPILPFVRGTLGLGPNAGPSVFFGPFLLGVFVLFTAWMGIVNQHEGRIAQIWVPNPVVFVVLMRASWRRWPAYLGAATAGNFLADLLAGDSYALGAGLTLANLLEVVLATAPLKRWFPGGLDLTRMRHLRAFVLVSTLAAPAVSALVAAAVIVPLNGAQFGWTWLIWSSADALSLLVLVPLISVVIDRGGTPLLDGRRIEAVIWTALLGLTLYVTFKLGPYPLLFLPILVLVYMSARIGPSGLVLGIVPTAATAFAYTQTGTGPVAQSGLGPQGQILLLEGFLAASVLAVLPVVAMLADKARLETSLNEAKALFLGVFDSSPEMLIVQYQDADGVIKVQTCNENAALAFGVSQEECVGRTVESLVRGKASRNVIDDIVQVMGTGHPVRRTRRVKHQGRAAIFEDISVPLRDPSGKVTRVLSSVRDLTARLEAEEAVRQSEARHRLLSENTTDMIAEFDLGLRCTYVSPASREIIGFAPVDLVGTDPYEHCLQEDAQEIQKAVAPLIEGTFSHAASTHRALHRDGRTVWVETRWSLVRSEAGRPAGVVASMRDVTERKQAEIALVRAQAEAERASAAKSDFLATMSHEIRTPLNGIAGYAGLLMSEGGLPARSRRHVERIQTASQVLKTVVDDVLDFSKIEAGRVELVPSTFRLTRLVDDVVAIVRGAVPADGPDVEGEVAPSLDGVHHVGDENRLRQILLNLLNNAVKFTQAGSVDLRITDQGLADGARRLRFAVRDTGIGISPEQQKLLFRKFSQIDTSAVRRYGGTGLGLAISQRLVGLMGGTIEVQSSLGAGSEFAFEISLPEHPDTLPQVEAARSDAASCSCRVLVVEDVEANRELVVSVLSGAGHATEAVADGVEAVEMAARGGFDLVLMDIQMPRMDGLAAARRIRALPGPEAEVPIVAMTANVLPSQIAAIREAGMNDHVGKPFEIQALERTVARWAGGRTQSVPAAAPSSALSAQVPETAYRTLVASIGPENSRRVFEGFEQELRRRFQDGERSDRGELARDAHAIRGEAGQLGFPALAQACRELEDACEAGVGVETPMERVALECRRALEAIALLRAA